jgi:hypothetical protein
MQAVLDELTRATTKARPSISAMAISGFVCFARTPIARFVLRRRYEIIATIS